MRLNEACSVVFMRKSVGEDKVGVGDVILRYCNYDIVFGYQQQRQQEANILLIVCTRATIVLFYIYNPSRMLWRITEAQLPRTGAAAAHLMRITDSPPHLIYR